MADERNRKLSSNFQRHVVSPLDNLDPHDQETNFKLFFALDLYRDEFAGNLCRLLQSGRPLLYAYHNTDREPVFYSYDDEGLKRAQAEWQEYDMGRLRVVLVDDIKVTMVDRIDPKVFKRESDRAEALRTISDEQRDLKHCVSVVSLREMDGFPLDLKDLPRNRMN